MDILLKYFLFFIANCVLTYNIFSEPSLCEIFIILCSYDLFCCYFRCYQETMIVIQRTALVRIYAARTVFC